MFWSRRPVLTFVAVALLAIGSLSSAACGGGHKSTLPAANSAEPDEYLFNKGNEYMGKKNWITARQYFKRLIDSYPQSLYRNDARLLIGDSYIGENRIESYILAVGEFKQFLQYAPGNTKADYAQFKICVASSRQMLSAQRDQTATREALAECDTFLRSYPRSIYRVEGEQVRRKVRDRLSEYEFNVGLAYYKNRWLPGAEPRWKQLMVEDPAYNRMDKVYYWFAELLRKEKRYAEAIPMYDRVGQEFPKSELIKKAQQRIAEIKKVTGEKVTADGKGGGLTR